MRMRVPADGKPTDTPPSPAGLPPLFLFVGYAALCAAPLILAVVQGHAARNIFRELSSGFVMVAFAMTLLQFALSGRFEWLSGRIGIDRTMRFHQLAGRWILVLVVLHPLLYAAPRLVPDPVEALGVLGRMFSSEGLRSGVVAWCLMILLVPLAVFRDRLPISYELWRLSHGLLAVAIAMAGTHHTLRVGTYSAGGALAALWTTAMIVAVLAMVHVYLLKPLLKRRAPYRVVSNRKVADGTWEIVVEPEHGAAMRFAAGQFVWLKFGPSPFGLTEHPFSMSSAPADRPRIAFTIRESGDYTRRIGAVAPGTRAFLDGPHGNFTLAGRKAKGVVFIAGGVGLAPIMAILRQLKAERYPHKLRLVYGNRVETQIVYRDEIEALKETLDLDVRYVLSEPPPGWTGEAGDLSPDVVGRCMSAVAGEEWHFFACGPPPMMHRVEQALIAHGVPRSRIVLERFKYD